MHLLKQLKTNFSKFIFLGLNESLWWAQEQDKKDNVVKQEKSSLDAFKDQKWYKDLSVEQQQIVENKIESKSKLEKKINQMKSEIGFKWLSAEIITKWIDRNKPLIEDAEDKGEIMSFENRVDMLNRDIDMLNQEIYAYNLELNSDNLNNSFDKANKNFKENFADSLWEWKASDGAKEIIENKDLSTITAWEIYALRQEWFDLSSLLLVWWEKPVSKNDMKAWDSFTVNFWWNKSLNDFIWAWDLLAIEKYDKVRINWIEWTRKFNPRPWFYSAEWKYLAVYDNYKVEILSEKQVTPDELEESKNAFKMRFEEIRGTELSGLFRDIIESNSDETSIELEWFSSSDLEFLKWYLSRYIPKDKIDNIDFDVESKKITTKDGKSVSAYMKESMPMWAWYEKYKDIVKEVCSRHPRVPENRLVSLINHENGKWDPMASPPGGNAYWLWQMIDSTWSKYGAWLDRNNPVDQLEATCKYLEYIMDRNNCPIEMAMAYYNTWEWIKSVSDSTAKHFYDINPAIARKIPSWNHIDAKTYLTWAVAYYNDISFGEASTKV